jgi:hypothetical protein
VIQVQVSKDGYRVREVEECVWIFGRRIYAVHAEFSARQVGSAPSDCFAIRVRAVKSYFREKLDEPSQSAASATTKVEHRGAVLERYAQAGETLDETMGRGFSHG